MEIPTRGVVRQLRRENLRGVFAKTRRRSGTIKGRRLMSQSLYPDPPMAPEAAEASRPKGGPGIVN